MVIQKDVVADQENPLLLVTTVKEMSAMFGVPLPTAKKIVYEGKVVAVQSGAIWLVLLADCVRYFEHDPIYWPDRFGKNITEAGE